jgi:hypothetical protein
MTPNFGMPEQLDRRTGLAIRGPEGGKIVLAYK